MFANTRFHSLNRLLTFLFYSTFNDSSICNFMKLDLVKRTFNYAVVNKPSGMVCDASHTNNIITALTNEFTKILPSVNSSQFRLVQRLDRFVTGGLVVARNKKWADKVRKSFFRKVHFDLQEGMSD